MKMSILKTKKQRINLWLWLGILLVTTSLFTRILLLLTSWQQVDATFINIAGIFLVGFFYDLVSAVYFSAPLVLYLWLIPDSIFNKPWHRFVLYALFFIFVFLLLFNGVAEWLFWDEFASRFNFIAVDYLVYTTEVIGNINQSYPVEWIIAVVLILAVAITALIRPRLSIADQTHFPFRQRSKFAFIYALFFTGQFFIVNTQYHHFSKNTCVNELAGNGLYELFAAYLHNELDYERFYKGVNNEQAFDMVHAMICTPEATLINRHIAGVDRNITNSGPEKKLNIVLISVESFSADFMKQFGNTEGITPFLDSLSEHSLIFTNLFATGTRTVRGLEALSLCVPPTPGQSIVRRPNNEHLFSLGKVFHDKGYQCEYIYGGYGYFDNMNYFFAHNEYEVVDRTALEDGEIHYENIWGVADEDLFSLAIREMDQKTKDRPVFAHIMTTSNHRPYTYPDGRIDIPSHTGRNGAVKYTDYSIGQFIKKASHKDWFGNTIFIIVADHCASSAGKTKLPVRKYHIPMLIYSPGNIQPGIMNRLMSQIDIGPTLLGMLNFSYTSKFFGYDMFKLKAGRERAFISTYQNLGYLKHGKLVILSPRQQVESFILSDKFEPLSTTKDDSLVREAIAWYQTASYSFSHGLMKQ
jgi:phosphoglycerol transferase MdoB-like AlkP superfamily enzyme